MAKVKRVLGVVVIVALLIGSSAPFFTSTNPAAAQGDEFESFSPELAEQLAEIYKQKQDLTPVQRKIDWSILQVIREVEKRISAAHPGETPSFQDLSTPLLKTDDVGNIEVKLTVTSSTNEQLEQLKDMGMQIGLTLPEYGVIEGSLRYDQVEAVAGLDFVVNVATPGYAVHNTGDVTSEGDTVLRAAEARAAFDVDGSGVKVGVISTGVPHLSDSVATGDLPSVQVLKAGEYDDEGTAMLEIVHDLAPGSPLAFYGPGTSSDMVAGIAALEAAGCNIIVDDLIYYDEPKFEDGPIAQEARQFITDGGVYVTSAGNNGERHYIHQYARTTAPPGSGYPYAHDYGGGDNGNTFTIPEDRTIITILQWNNQWGTSADDFDLYLVRASDDFPLAGSANWQDGDDDPWEGLGWTNDTGSSVSVYIAVLEFSLVNPPSSLILDYNVYHGSGLEYFVPENSVIGHSAVEEVLSTAAAYWGTPDTIEDFSSCGPGTVYFPIYEERQVPNITGVDGVQTKTGQLGHFSNPFYGTSASAPHVAAIAALVWDANPALTSSGVFNAITSTAVDLGPFGWDSTWGFGRVDAYEAVASVVTGPLVASVSIEPSSQTVPAGGSFNVDVVVDSAGLLVKGCQVTVIFCFDLTATAATGYDLLGTAAETLRLGPMIPNGEVSYSVVRMAGNDPATVAGDFMTIDFNVDPAATGSYDLIIEATLLGADGLPIPGVVENDGQVIIVTNGRKGDFDGDGDIDILDFVYFADAYGSETGDPNYNTIGDFDDDGDIDILDFVNFADVYGT